MSMENEAGWPAFGTSAKLAAGGEAALAAGLQLSVRNPANTMM